MARIDNALYTISQKSLEPTDQHIRILEDRFLYAARRREKLLEKNPDFTDEQLWAIDQDLQQKKQELETALDEQRKHNRNRR